MSLATPQDYWIRPDALSITLNAMNNPDLIQASVLANASVIAYKRGVIPYTPSHDFRRWRLIAYNHYFPSSDAYYVHIRMPRSEKSSEAMVVYTLEKRDIEGRVMLDDGTFNEETDPDFFYVCIGAVSSSSGASGETKNRTWTESVQTGTLGTDQSVREDAEGGWTKMFSLNLVSDVIEVLKTIASATINTLRVGTELVFGDRSVKGVATSEDVDQEPTDDTLATPSYVKAATEKQFLDKVSPAAQSVVSDVEFLGSVSQQKRSLMQEGFQVGTFEPGVSGAAMDKDGNGEVESLSARDALSAESLKVGKDRAGMERPFQVDESGNVRGADFTLESVKTDNFQEGVSGFEILKKDANGHSYLEIDKLYARVKAIFNDVEIRSLRYAGGNYMFTPAGATVTKVETVENAETKEKWYKCYFSTDDGETKVKNEFREDDLVFAQEFDVIEDGATPSDEPVETYRFWRKCIGTGEDYIILSDTDCEGGSDIPKNGIDIVTFGNASDTDRQNVIAINTIGANAPSIIQYDGVNEYKLVGKDKTVISPAGNKFTGSLVVTSSSQTGTSSEGKDVYDALNETITNVRTLYKQTDTDEAPELPNKGDYKGWEDESPEWKEGTFVWTTTEVTYATGKVNYSSATNITGSKGADGKNSCMQYTKNTSATVPPSSSGGWQPNPPPISEGEYIWKREGLYSFENLVDENGDKVLDELGQEVTVRGVAWGEPMRVTGTAPVETIGGRNLLRKTNQGTTGWSHENESNTMEAYRDDDGQTLGVRFIVGDAGDTLYFDLGDALTFIVPNQTYTLSFAIHTTKVTGRIDFYLCTEDEEGDEYHLTEGGSMEVLEAGWNNVSATFTTTDFLAEGTDYNQQQLLLCNLFVSDDTYQIKNLKLEKGNNATDWSPAPEDAEEQISLLWSKFSVTDGKMESLQTQITEQGESFKSSIEQTAQNISLEVSAVDEKVGETNTKLLATGIDIENKKIQLTADNLIVKNNEGETTMKINSDAVLETNGGVFNNVTVRGAIVQDWVTLVPYNPKYHDACQQRADSVDGYFNEMVLYWGSSTTDAKIKAVKERSALPSTLNITGSSPYGWMLVNKKYVTRNASGEVTVDDRALWNPSTLYAQFDFDNWLKLYLSENTDYETFSDWYWWCLFSTWLQKRNDDYGRQISFRNLPKYVEVDAWHSTDDELGTVIQSGMMFNRDGINPINFSHYDVFTFAGLKDDTDALVWAQINQVNLTSQLRNAPKVIQLASIRLAFDNQEKQRMAYCDTFDSSKVTLRPESFGQTIALNFDKDSALWHYITNDEVMFVFSDYYDATQGKYYNAKYRGHSNGAHFVYNVTIEGDIAPTLTDAPSNTLKIMILYNGF